MAKKRTLVPYYGKKNQRLEKAGEELLKKGQSVEAALLFAKSKVVYHARRAARLG